MQVNKEKLAAFDYFQLVSTLPKEIKKIIQHYWTWDFGRFSYDTLKKWGHSYRVACNNSFTINIVEHGTFRTFHFVCRNIFIADEPKGHAILLFLGPDDTLRERFSKGFSYVFIYDKIVSFTADKIIKFESQKNKYDQVYAYAIDIHNRVYLFDEEINIHVPPEFTSAVPGCPKEYTYFYDNFQVIPNIILFWGSDSTNPWFTIHPGFAYDTDPPCTVQIGDQEERHIEREEFIQIHEEHARRHDIRPLLDYKKL
jgi:hypothetical protein